MGQNCLKIFEFLTPKNEKKSRKKNREKLFLAQNCLNRIMSQISDYTKKLTKIEKKNRKIILGSEFSEAKNELTFRINQKKWQKIEEKNRKIIFGSEFSETDNEPTFG